MLREFQSASTSRQSMTIEEREKADLERFITGPLSIVTNAEKNKTQIMIHCRNGRKLLGRVKAYDRHINLILENAKEMWTERPKLGKGKRGSIAKERFVPKLFVRGDSVIIIVQNPKLPVPKQ